MALDPRLPSDRRAGRNQAAAGVHEDLLPNSKDEFKKPLRLANEGQPALTLAKETGLGYIKLVRPGSPAGGKQEEPLTSLHEPPRPARLTS
jgi:hypothetical protein